MKRKLLKHLEWMETFVNTDSTEKAKSEIQRYIDEEPCKIWWWKHDETRFPALASKEIFIWSSYIYT